MDILINYFKNNQINELEKELNEIDIDLNLKGRFGCTLLHLACIKGYFTIVQLLIKNSRVQINISNKKGYTPFHFACGYGCAEAVDILLNNNLIQNGEVSSFDNRLKIVQLLMNDPRIEINALNKYGYTPFHLACETGNLDIIKILIKDQRVKINTFDNNGWSPFHSACENENLEIIKFLMKDPRIEINTFDKNGWTSFHLICLIGKLKIINLFLSSNRKINIKKQTTKNIQQYPSGTTGFDILKDRNITLEEIQKDKISNNNLFLFSTADGNLEILKKLLPKKIKII